jgi:hypothetical protein
MDGAPAMKWVESLVYGDGAQKQKANTAAQPRVAPALVSHRLSRSQLAALPKTTTLHAVQE